MNVFLTGITGSLGQAVSKILLEKTSYHITGFSRDEKKQSEIASHERLTLILGDVRDQRRLIESTRNMDLILHFAALKRVDAMENNPEECIQTNVEGTINILGAQRANKVPRVVLSSTDKACLPINVYGYCKALSEKLVLRNKNNVVVRYGNVMASRGSAIPQFVSLIKGGQPIGLTHHGMTRFFMTIDSAAQFVIDAAFGSSGGLKINKEMKSCFIKDLPEIIAEVLNLPCPEINVTGMRPGEKIHEDLFHQYELLEKGKTSQTAFMFSRQELKDLISNVIREMA